MSPVTVNGFLGVNVSYTRGRLRSLEAYNFMGGGGGNFRAARIFFVDISLAGIFFRYAWTFSGLLAVHDFFSQFSLYFARLPITFLIVSPKDVSCIYSRRLKRLRRLRNDLDGTTFAHNCRVRLL